MRGLEDRVVVVTGGALGIGASACRRLVDEGATVAITDILDDEGEKLARSLANGDKAGTARYWHLDVTDEQDVERVLQEVSGAFGRIDAIVNNAGVSGPNKPTDQITAEEWDSLMGVNLRGVFFCTKHVIGHLRQAGGGSIVNLSSIYGIIGAADLPPYHASKGAVRLMTKNDALIYAKDRIRVNSVHPGFIWTPLVEDLGRQSDEGVEAFRAALDSRHPIGHVGEPEDIAAGIAFLVSDDAKFMTGSELVIDGGYTAQ